MRYAVPFIDMAAMTREVRTTVVQAWAELMDTSRFIGGPAGEGFERSWATYCGTSHAVGVGNGTDGLQLTLRALGIGQGDDVIVPANTFVASAEAVVLAGATPRFADVSPDTLLLTAETLDAAVTPRTRAVIVVHLYGQMPDMDALGRSADRAGIALIEDAAQAHGATWLGRPAGSVGRAGCFSFYPAKNLGAFGDAGAVVTSDPGLAERVARLRDHGRSGHHRHPMVGTNSRLDALQAVVLTAKLEKLDAWNQARRRIADRYRKALGAGPARLVAELAGSCPVYHLAVARVPHRERVQDRLRRMGIETGIHYPLPCHLQDPYRRFAPDPLPVAEQAAGDILSLPMFPHMTDEQLTRVEEALGEALTAEESYDA